MLVTERAARLSWIRRDDRAHKRDGFERVDEDGGKLWELHRGRRLDHVITHVVIAADGKSLWIKTAKVGN